MAEFYPHALRGVAKHAMSGRPPVHWSRHIFTDEGMSLVNPGCAKLIPSSVVTSRVISHYESSHYDYRTSRL
jgi:hypothetical protein